MNAMGATVMDINLLRSAVTVLGLLLFVGLWIWAFSRRRRADFDAAARLPLLEPDPPASGRAGEGAR